MRSLVFLFFLACCSAVQADRLKDLVSIGGVRENQLVGYGLVVGLPGNGDQTTQTQFTVQSLKNMLKQLGVVIPANVNPQLKNVAAVMVHASLPPFAQPGQTIDVTVSSIGNAKGLRGGSLLMTPMRGSDGEIYALAQGNLIVGGFGAEGADGSRVVVNIPTSGRIPNGATVERAVPSPFATSSTLQLQLHNADFGTARNVAEAINNTFGNGTAAALNSNSIQVLGPARRDSMVPFIAALHEVDVVPAEQAARVIVNSRTGTVVIGNNVRVSAAAITHGNLTVSVTEDYDVSQPGAFARRGRTAVTADSSIGIEEENNGMFLFEPGVSLEDIVSAVNKVGAAPGDLVAILEALQQAGALRAQLIVI